MLIYKKYGIFVFISLSLYVGTLFFLSKMILGPSSSPNYAENFEKLMLYTFWLPALYNFIFERLLCKNEGKKVFYDKNGKEIVVDDYSRFFFIRNKYWTLIIFLAYGIVMFINVFGKK